MKLIVSSDGYSVTGDKALKSFGYTVGKLNEKEYLENPWVIIIKHDDSIVSVFKNSDKITPKCYYLNDRLYVIIDDGDNNGFHYYIDLEDFSELIEQINSKKIILFGILDKYDNNIALLIEDDIIF
jgi:hypothetical protein